MGRTVEELLDSLSAEELADWAEFYALEPWGSEAAFVRSGIISAVIANVNRSTKDKPEPFTPADFIPDFGGKKRKAKMDPKRIRGLLSATFGNRIKKRDPNPKIYDHRSEGTGTDTQDPGAESGGTGGRQGSEGGGEDDSG